MGTSGQHRVQRVGYNTDVWRYCEHRAIVQYRHSTTSCWASNKKQVNMPLSCIRKQRRLLGWFIISQSSLNICQRCCVVHLPNQSIINHFDNSLLHRVRFVRQQLFNHTVGYGRLLYDGIIDCCEIVMCFSPVFFQLTTRNYVVKPWSFNGNKVNSLLKYAITICCYWNPTVSQI